MSNHNYIFIWVALHDLFESLDGFCIEGLDRIVVISYCFLGKAMPFEIICNQCTEILDFFGKSCKAQGGMAGTMDAKEESSFFSSS